MPKYTSGDLFAIPLPDKTYVIGRIMLDIRKQCIKPGIIDERSPLAFYDDTLLIELYREIVEQPEPKQSEKLVPGIFVEPKLIKSGAWTIVGHIDIDPTDVEFPETINLIGRGQYFVRGEVRIPLSPTSDNWHGIEVRPTIHSPLSIPDICLYYLGRADQIEPAYVQSSRLNDSDLRFHDQRSEVYHFLDLKEQKTYYQFALDHGFDVTRFYKTEKKSK